MSSQFSYVGPSKIVIDGGNYQLVDTSYLNLSPIVLVVGIVLICITLVTLLVIFLVLQSRVKRDKK